MSQPDAERFLKQVSINPHLRQKCLTLLSKPGSSKEIEKLAKEKGCLCSYEEVKQALSKNQDFRKTLSDEELLRVSGGGENKGITNQPCAF